MCLLAQAAVISATLWHHHDDHATVHECEICILAAAKDRIAQAAPSPHIAPTSYCGLIFFRQTPANGVPLPSPNARGPPLTA